MTKLTDAIQDLRSKTGTVGTISQDYLATLLETFAVSSYSPAPTLSSTFPSTLPQSTMTGVSIGSTN